MSALDPKLQRLIRQDVQGMHAYAVQESAGMVKLDAMENPYSLPPELQAELGQRLGKLALNRYPDGRVNDLRTALARYAGMPEGYELMLGNGSDELISLLAMACDVPGASILAPEPGFVMYALSAARPPRRPLRFRVAAKSFHTVRCFKPRSATKNKRPTLWRS